MFIEKLVLTDFRNYESLELSPGAGVNILYGSNGQGKTNILESVFYCSIGKSFRTSHDGELIRYGADSFRIYSGIKNDISGSVEISCTSKGEKAIRVNGIYLRKVGQLMGSLLTVLFSPEDLQLVNDGPSVRRKMIDIAVSQISPVHFYNLQQYNKVLRQKNNLLRDISFSPVSGAAELLDVYNEQLSAYGSRILFRRLAFTEKMSAIAAEEHRKIAPDEQLSVKYESDCLPEGFTAGGSVRSSDPGTAENIKILEENMQRCLTEARDREIERQQSVTGTHRDDLDLELSGTDLRKFGSQGQKRTAVLSLKLSELKILHETTGRKPVLLLDDVFSELDASRCRMLMESVSDIQTIITCTSPGELPQNIIKNAAVFEVKNGAVC